MALYIHANTEEQLRLLMKTPPHALLLTGAVGVGLATIAHQRTKLAGEQVIDVLPEKDEKVDLEKGTLTVGVIRKLYELLKTYEPKGRVVIIDRAEKMAIAAQNAFLKLLEEPAPKTRFVLLTHAPELLLPTIRSRVQTVAVREVTAAQSEALLDELKVFDATRRAQLLFIAKGLPAEIHRLTTDEAAFAKRAELVKDARAVVTGSPYERLLIAKKYKDSREQALLLLSDSMKQIQRTLTAGGSGESLKVLERLEVLHKRLSEQGNVRLQLSALVLL